MRRALVAVLALGSLAAARNAHAQIVLHDLESYRSSQSWALELRFAPFSPDVDSGFSNGATPHKEYFGTKRRLLPEIELDYQFFRGFGSLAIAGSVGYFRESAMAFLEAGAGTPAEVRSGDQTTLTLFPTAALLVYRLDELQRRTRFPLVPYAKAGLNYTLWSVHDANGAVSTSPSPMSGRGKGGTPGWQVAAGLTFLMDVIDPGAARELDSEVGVNHTYVFFEVAHIDGAGLGRQGVLHVGDTTWFVGLTFEF